MTDQRMRELTYKLIQMAPEAPPFPEEPLTQLKPHPTPTTKGPARRGLPTWAIAAGVAAIAIVLAIGLPLLFLAGGDGVEPATPTTTPPPTSVPVTTLPPTTPPVPVDVTLYFFADYVEAAFGDGPHLVPVRRTVEITSAAVDTHDRFGAALVALIEGPSAVDAERYPGITSEIPGDVELLGYTLDNTTDTGLAVIDLSADVVAEGSFVMINRLAQIVFTATQFPEIDVVEFTIDGVSGDDLLGELAGPKTRDTYIDALPPIFVESPLAGSNVDSPISITGFANTFEASLQYRIELADGTLLADGFTTATCGTGCWGTYEVTQDYTLAAQSDGFVVLFESSAQDGSDVNVVRVPVTLAPAEGPVEGVNLEIFAELPGGIPVNGAVVVEPELTITGFTNAADLTFDGTTVDAADGTFEATVLLEPGVNEFAIVIGPETFVYTVTYLPGGTVEFGFLTAVGTDEITADYAQWLTGAEADQAAIEDGEIAEGETVPNGYYIRNVNDQLRDLPMSDDVSVWLPTPAFGSVTMVTSSVDEWLSLFGADGAPWDVEAGDQPPSEAEPHFGYFGAAYAGTPYWIVLDGGGSVVQLVGQYRP